MSRLVVEEPGMTVAEYVQFLHELHDEPEPEPFMLIRRKKLPEVIREYVDMLKSFEGNKRHLVTIEVVAERYRASRVKIFEEEDKVAILHALEVRPRAEVAELLGMRRSQFVARLAAWHREGHFVPGDVARKKLPEKFIRKFLD